MVKHLIILNPIDTMVKINASETEKQIILSSAESCRKALGRMELTPCSRSIISFLRANERNFKTVVISDSDSEPLRVILRHFDIPCLAVIGGQRRKATKYKQALGLSRTAVDDAVVISGNSSDIREAEMLSIRGLLYGEKRNMNGVRCIEDLIYHLGIKLTKPDDNKSRMTV